MQLAKQTVAQASGARTNNLEDGRVRLSCLIVGMEAMEHVMDGIRSQFDRHGDGFGTVSNSGSCAAPAPSSLSVETTR
jgi:hypothetical protein